MPLSVLRRSPIHDLGIPFAMPKADRAVGRNIHAGSSYGHPLSLESDQDKSIQPIKKHLLEKEVATNSEANKDGDAADPTIPFHGAPRGHYRERLHRDQAQQAQQAQHVLFQAVNSNHKRL